MSESRWQRVAAVLAGAWAGLIGAIGFVAAPVLFATLARADAGRVAARLFEIDAQSSLAFGAVLLLLALRRSHGDLAPGASRFGAEMMLALGALFCVVAGYYAPQPMMEASRRGESGPSFAVLHGVGATFFAIKFAIVAVLAWRSTGAATTTKRATAAAPTS